MEKVCIFYGHLEYILAIWNIFLPFGIIYDIWTFSGNLVYIFPLCPEKSGNPGPSTTFKFSHLHCCESGSSVYGCRPEMLTVILLYSLSACSIFSFWILGPMLWICFWWLCLPTNFNRYEFRTIFAKKWIINWRF
jgi:hypothetical protein